MHKRILISQSRTVNCRFWKSQNRLICLIHQVDISLYLQKIVTKLVYSPSTPMFVGGLPLSVSVPGNLKISIWAVLMITLYRIQIKSFFLGSAEAIIPVGMSQPETPITAGPTPASLDLSHSFQLVLQSLVFIKVFILLLPDVTFTIN